VGQTASTTGPVPPHSSHTSSFETNDASTDFAIKAQGRTVILPHIETHVYLDIELPSRSWNAIQLPCTKLVTSDDSSGIAECIKPLLLIIVVRTLLALAAIRGLDVIYLTLSMST
jgi:hypothetical protein